MFLTYSFPFFVLDRNIFSFDTDRKRLAVMQRLMKTAGASCVTTSNCSFLEVSITEKSSAQVKTLISCSRGLKTRTAV